MAEGMFSESILCVWEPGLLEEKKNGMTCVYSRQYVQPSILSCEGFDLCLRRDEKTVRDSFLGECSWCIQNSRNLIVFDAG